MLLSRRQVMSGLAGLAAMPLAACASRPSPATSVALLPPRRRATGSSVMNPGDFGLDAVIDLSHNSQVSDFSAAHFSSNILGVLHKASEGSGWNDPLYAQRRQQAQSADLLWGAYHFGTFQHSGEEQAAAFLAAAEPTADTLIALDLELNERAPGNSMDLPQAEAFVTSILATTGRLPLLYVQPNWADGEVNRRSGRSLGGMISPQSILTRCDLWLADYRMDPELPRGWSDLGWRFWQYAGDSSAGGPFGPLARTVAGIDRCDRNLFKGTAQDLGRYWTVEAGRPVMAQS